MQRKWVTLPSPLDRVAQNLPAAVDVQVRMDQGKPRIALTELYQSQPVRSFQHAVSLRISHGDDDEWNRLAQLPDQSHLLGSEYPEMRKKAAAAIDRMAQNPTPVALLRTFRMLVSVLQPNELPTVLRDHLRAWVSGQFPNATLHVVKVDSLLPGRFRFPQMATGMVAYPELAQPGQLSAPRFQSLEGLNSRDVLIGAAPFLRPLVLSTAPAMHSILASRFECSFVLDLDVAVDGTKPNPQDLLSEFLPEFSDRGFVPLPPEDTTSTLVDRAAARDWWVSRLIDLFSVLLNPARFDDRGVYVPAAHLATTLGALNLFEYVDYLRARVSRDVLGRRLACFTALDTLDGLHYLSAAEMLNPVRARKTLDDVEAAMTREVARVLLPVPRQAVNYLDHHRDEFFIPSWSSQDPVMLPGRSQATGKSRLVADHLRAIRNGHHSFRKLLQPGTDDQAVLTAHTGHIADPIMDLPMLYLIHVMLNPQRILPKHLRDRA